MDGSKANGRQARLADSCSAPPGAVETRARAGAGLTKRHRMLRAGAGSSASACAATARKGSRLAEPTWSARSGRVPTEAWTARVEARRRAPRAVAEQVARVLARCSCARRSRVDPCCHHERTHEDQNRCLPSGLVAACPPSLLQSEFRLNETRRVTLSGNGHAGSGGSVARPQPVCSHKRLRLKVRRLSGPRDGVRPACVPGDGGRRSAALLDARQNRPASDTWSVPTCKWTPRAGW